MFHTRKCWLSMWPGRKAVRRPGRRPACPKQGENEDPGKTTLRALECVEELFTLFLAACLSLPASRFLLSRARHTRSLLSQIHSSLFFCSARLQNTTALHPTL